MGKVDFAFDHIKDNHTINELSVVLYTDSFFYGLWDKGSGLVKTGYHPIASLDALVQLWNYYFVLDSVKVLSTIKPFVHLADEDYEEQHFDLYFKGLYNLERADHNVRTVDEFQHHDISTLHLVEQQAIKQLAKLKAFLAVAHISTAMVNFCTAEKGSLLCYLANNVIHISLLDEKGFRLYNQYDCYYTQDYLYFLVMIFKKFKLDPTKTSLQIGGNLDEKSELHILLSSYFKKLKFFSKTMSIPKSVKNSRSYYSDLHLCRTCV